MSKSASGATNGGGDAAIAPREVRIVGLGAGGDGIIEASTANAGLARHYLPFALPGEVWRLAPDREPVVIEAAADRAAPSCRHFGQCGGCVAQHMSPARYAAWKTQALVDAFAHRGLEVKPADLVRVPPSSRRRATFAAELPQSGAPLRLGFHRAGSHLIEPISDCVVLDAQIVAALPALRELAETVLAAASAGGRRRPRRSPRRKPQHGAVGLRLAVLSCESGLAVDITGHPDRIASACIAAEAMQGLAAIAERHRIAVVSLEGEVMVKRGTVRLTIAGIAVEAPPAAFVQAVAAAERDMAQIAMTALSGARRVADLFAGLGTFTLALAAGAKVLAVDSDAASLDALRRAALAAKGLKPIEIRRRDLMRDPLSPRELESVDAVLFDPPRAGASAQSAAIARSNVATVVAVSCNPATLARDARLLVDGGYVLERLVPIDQFLYSAHLEAVAVFRR